METLDADGRTLRAGSNDTRQRPRRCQDSPLGAEFGAAAKRPPSGQKGLSGGHSDALLMRVLIYES
jgi:hypothetical protein